MSSEYKKVWLVWLLNWPVLGLGTMYVTGASGYRWALAGVIIQIILASSRSDFFVWFFWYLGFSVVGTMLACDFNEKAARRSAAEPRLAAGDRADGRSLGASDHFATTSFRQKLAQAELKLASKSQAVTARPAALLEPLPANDRLSPGGLGASQPAAEVAQASEEPSCPGPGEEPHALGAIDYCFFDPEQFVWSPETPYRFASDSAEASASGGGESGTPLCPGCGRPREGPQPLCPSCRPAC